MEPNQLTPAELKLAILCVTNRLELERRNCTPAMKKTYAHEPKVLKRIALSEEAVPQLTELLKKLKGK